MSFFGINFPYTNLNNLNLDWILERVKAASDMADTVEDRLTAVETQAAAAETTAEAAETTAAAAETTAAAAETAAGDNSAKIAAANVSRVSRYNPGGRNLVEVFGSLAALHAAVNAGDFTNIFVGDYIQLPIVGTLHDYAGNVDLALNTSMVFEVAAIDYYYRTGNPINNRHHLIMLARNAIPQALKMRSANKVEYNTDEVGLWRRSALFETLNNTSNGFVALLNSTDVAPYIQSGGCSTRVGVWTAEDTGPTSVSWTSTGSVFIPNHYQVFGIDPQMVVAYQETSNDYDQFELLATPGRNSKNISDNASSRVDWWVNAFFGNYGFTLTVNKYGFGNRLADNRADTYCVPCFLFI